MELALLAAFMEWASLARAAGVVIFGRAWGEFNVGNSASRAAIAAGVSFCAGCPQCALGCALEPVAMGIMNTALRLRIPTAILDRGWTRIVFLAMPYFSERRSSLPTSKHTHFLLADMAGYQYPDNSRLEC